MNLKAVLYEFARLIVLLMTLFSSSLLFSDEQNWELNEAQKLIYTTPHFLSVSAGSIISYQFESNVESVKSPDSVEVRILKSYDQNKCDVQIRFLSGSNQIKFPDFIGYRGNPVIIGFLERDVRQMKKSTGGSDLYFRNRIRHALADDPLVEMISIEHDGSRHDAYQITFLPYLNVPLSERLSQYMKKVYRITLSETVPGYVVALSTEVDNDSYSAKETLRFGGVSIP